MDNPETQPTFGAKHKTKTIKAKTTTKKTKMMTNTNHIKHGGEPRCSRWVNSSSFL